MLVREFLIKNNTVTIPQHPYSANMAVVLQDSWKLLKELQTIAKIKFEKFVDDWKKSWLKCIISNENYFENPLNFCCIWEIVNRFHTISLNYSISQILYLFNGFKISYICIYHFIRYKVSWKFENLSVRYKKARESTLPILPVYSQIHRHFRYKVRD